MSTARSVDEYLVEVMVPVTGELTDERKVAECLVSQAKEQGLSLVGPGGLLSSLTKTVFEAALEADMTELLGHEHGQIPCERNERNGTRVKDRVD